MVDSKIAAMAGVLALVLVAAPGCVGSKLFKSNIEDTDGRIAAVEDAIEDNEKSLDRLKKDTDQRIGATQQQAQDAAAIGNRAMDRAATT